MFLCFDADHHASKNTQKTIAIHDNITIMPNRKESKINTKNPYSLINKTVIKMNTDTFILSQKSKKSVVIDTLIDFM